MFSQTAEYALRAVVHLADCGGVPCTAKDIAEATFVPVDYLSKVMQQLVRANIVRGQRGKCGGFSLNVPFGNLTVYDVVNAVDPVRRLLECPLGLTAHKEQLCPLHRKLDQSLASFERDLKSTCIAELVEKPAVLAAKAGVGHAD